MPEEGKKYQNQELTLQKMREFLSRLRQGGHLIIPGERELSEIVGCSRKNLRNVLRHLHDSGEITHKGRHRTLSLQNITGGSVIGSIGFVAVGRTKVDNIGWNKLWAKLQPACEAAGINSKLILISYDSTDEEVRQQLLQAPEHLVVARLKNEQQRLELRKMEDKKIIYLDDNFCSPDDSLIIVDNYKVGFRAAEELHRRGYKKPAALFSNNIVNFKRYKMYEDRIIGFREGCQKFGLDFSNSSEFWVDGRNLKLILRLVRCCPEIIRNNYDSVFLYSDDNVEFVYCAFEEESIVIPNDLGLVTVNSFDNALGHNPPISAVGHATTKVTNKLVEILSGMLSGEITGRSKYYLEPGFHEGTTLRPVQKG